MTRRWLILSVVAGVLSTPLIQACSDSAGPSGQDELTAEQQQRIQSAYEAVSASADSVLVTDDPSRGFDAMLASYREIAGVEDAWLTDEALFVKYEDGGIVSWYLAEDPIVPPYFPQGSELDWRAAERPPAALMGPIGRQDVLLMNQVSNDERFHHVNRITNELNSTLAGNGFTVAQRDNEDIELGFLDSELSDYGLIFITTHGMYDGTHHWFLTGERGSLLELMTVRLLDWINDRVAIGKTRERHGARSVVVSYFKVSNDFIDHHYGAGDFPNSLVYFNACQIFMGNNQMGEVFASKGAQATVGWTESQCSGHFTGQMLIDAMVGGLTLGEAIASLPEEATVDYCSVPTGARLTFHPAGGASTELTEGVVASAELNVVSPVAGASYTMRVVPLSGRLVGPETIEYGTVELNNQTTPLDFSGLEFSQPLVLKSGTNTIRANAIGRLSDGRRVFATSGAMTVVGDFAVLDLWTELRWNTDYSDVDLHLLPPGATLDDLWTNTDCYFGNMTTEWGCELDVDDVEGYGPEHITVQSALLDGTYRLFVHYWDEDGAGVTDAFVSVAVRDGPILSFGPYELINDGGTRRGDVWEVATIAYPSGAVTDVSNRITFESASTPANLAVKK
jgi:uncharacterized protein YfaP (DUF2135 family)